MDPLPPEEHGQNPDSVILFDGVCNLCNAAVQWVLERDRAARFKFASLQSQAATDLLRKSGVAGVEALPDSIALVDRDGVHLRSDAALRIGRGLGFPYRLITLTRPVPRSIRDGIYDWVARNRYRWFGKRDTCMLPTPDRARRFLDGGALEGAASPLAGSPEAPTGTAVPNAGAGEPPAPVDDAVGGASRPSHTHRSWVTAWLTRFAIAYVVVYMAPFPLTLLGYLGALPGVDLIPGFMTAVGWIASLHGRVMTPLVVWTADALFGISTSAAGTGSGDRAFNYVDLLLDLVLALLVSVAWTVAVRRRQVSPRVFDGSRTLARFYLGTTMLLYGWIKLFPLQFILPGPDRLLQPYGDSSPMGLAWTFLGASIGYQMFAGASELIAGYLLFWRRTALLGALAAFAVLLNVFAINMFFDVPVKLFSGHLILMSVFIMAPDLPRLAGLFGFGLPTHPDRTEPFWSGWSALRPPRVGWIHTAFVLAITAFHVSNNLSASRQRGVLAEPHPLAQVYRVQDFTLDGQTGRDLEDGERWVRFGLNPRSSVATVQWASGLAVRMRLTVDTEAETLSFYDRGGSPPPTPDMTYRVDGDGTIHLQGLFEGDTIRASARPEDEDALLRSRGFHWVNEYPFNR